MTAVVEGEIDQNSKAVMATYEKKSFGKEEWQEHVRSTQLPAAGEPSVPLLLLNYFVCMAFEESSVRMARELGYVKSNREAEEFNELYRIRERSHIGWLIKRGRVAEAMERISEVFGTEVLEGDEGGQEEDLHFKLLLLNLTEMIRQHRSQPEGPSHEFILKLVEYSQQKLAIKAASSRSHMQELELVMTLLLVPHDGEVSKLPRSLRGLYSLPLRAQVAEMVNRRLLRSMHTRVANGKYPDLIGGMDSGRYTGVLRVRPKEDIATELTTHRLGGLRDDGNGDWGSLAKMLGGEDDGEDKFEARLVQVMKLWAWCENQLHGGGIGVPRVEA